MNLLTINDRPGAYPQSYYAAMADLPPERPRAQGDIRADVAIVGAGFTGLSAALHLARRGLNVVVLEASRTGFGASGRNGGQVGTGMRRDQDELEAMVGAERARALWDLSQEAVALVQSLCGDFGQPFHSGIVHADHRARYVPHSHGYAEKLSRNYGYDLIRTLDRDSLRDIVNSPAYFGGTLDMGAGHIDPLQFALGLAQAASDAGAAIHERSPVTRITDDGVETEAARVTAEHVLIACNGYLGGLDGRVAAHVMPINNFIVATEPLGPERQEQIIAGNHAVADSKFVVNYFRFSPDYRLLFGGTESYGWRFPGDIAAKVRRPMQKIFPQLAGVGITHAWGGTLGITMNRMPHFARLGRGRWSASGYSGHGVAMATLGGKLAADAIAGQAEGFDMMASVPSPRFPGGVALRWPLLVLAMIWYSMRDKL